MKKLESNRLPYQIDKMPTSKRAIEIIKQFYTKFDKDGESLTKRGNELVEMVKRKFNEN
jgi:hypothetical protein